MNIKLCKIRIHSCFKFDILKKFYIQKVHNVITLMLDDKDHLTLIILFIIFSFSQIQNNYVKFCVNLKHFGTINIGYSNLHKIKVGDM